MHRVGRDGVQGLASIKEAGIGEDSWNWLPRIVPGSVIAWVSGEIDVRCHLVRITEQQGSETLPKLVHPYLNTITEFSRLTKSQSFVLSVSPAMNSRNRNFPCEGSLEERRELTIKVNDLLAQECRNRGVSYCDLWSKVVDSEGAILEGFTEDGIHLGKGAAHLLYREVVAIVEDLNAPVEEG